MGRSLQNIYCGIEGIFRDFMLEIDGTLTKSPRFHSDLLDRTTKPSSMRPAVMRDSIELRDLMRFRHAFRNVYGEELEAVRLLDILDGVENQVFPDLKAGLQGMKKFLEDDSPNNHGPDNPPP